MSFIEFWRKKSNWRTIFPRHSNLKWDIFGQILCHEIFSVIIRIEWWLWRRSIIEASLPMASCQNVRPSHLQCPTADLRVMHGFCRSTSTFFYNAQCLKTNHQSLIWILSLPTIIFVSRQLVKYLRLFFSIFKHCVVYCKRKVLLWLKVYFKGKFLQDGWSLTLWWEKSHFCTFFSNKSRRTKRKST